MRVQFTGNQDKSFVNSAKTAAKAQAKKFFDAPCCCSKVTIIVKGIALKPPTFFTPGDPGLAADNRCDSNKVIQSSMRE